MAQHFGGKLGCQSVSRREEVTMPESLKASLARVLAASISYIRSAKHYGMIRMEKGIIQAGKEVSVNGMQRVLL
jgi:hypothetical protein